jgi:hypothetical protein
MGIALGGGFLLSPVLIVKMIIAHRERVERIRNHQEGAPMLVQEMQALKAEMATLRETTTRFDMSFDAALHRVENRLDGLEREAQTEPSQNYSGPVAPASTPAPSYARQYGDATVESPTVLRRG